MYDLSTLDCLDFTDPKWAGTNNHKGYSKGGKIFGMSAEEGEPRFGMYFNRRLLEEAGINPDSLYDLQEKGEWTWDKLTEIMSQVQRDIDNDGVIDVYGHCANDANVYLAAVGANEVQFVDLVDGKYTYNFEDPKVMEALNWAVDMMKTYNCEFEGDNWDYFKDAFKNGKAAFLTAEAYMMQNDLKDMQDDFGFLCFPKGPNASDYHYFSSNNVHVIPGCYDAERAWKIAFAYNLIKAPIPEFEDYSAMATSYATCVRDAGSLDYTVPRMIRGGVPAYYTFISEASIGENFTWTFGIFGDATPASAVESTKEIWMQAIEKANK